MWSTVIERSRGALLPLLLALAGPAAAGPARADERHPRAPDQPLTIRLTPWYCSECVERRLIEGEPREVELMRTTVEKLTRQVGIRRDWIVIESPNFKIFSTLKATRVKHSDSRFAAADLARLTEVLPDYKVGSQASYVTAHQRAHLYHVRLERIYAHFSALTGNEERWLGMKGRFEAYLFHHEKRFRTFAEEVLGKAPGDSTVVRYHMTGGDNFLALAAADRLFKRGDGEFCPAVIHNLGHLLVNGHHNFYTDAWAWLEEGCAHYYGRRETTKHNFFCIGFARPPAMLVRGNWNKRIRHSVYRNKESSLGRWSEKVQPRELAALEHGQSWSLVKWLIETDPVRFGKLMDQAADHKTKRSSAQAIEEVFAVTPDVLHERWRAHVLKQNPN